VKDGRIRVVDFQDARLGPAAYDLASLLRDSYVVLPVRLREEMLDLFLERIGGDTLRSRFLESFDVVALQRNLKAIGTFAYQATVLGRNRYLDSVPATWEYVRDEISRLPAYRGAASLLERIAALCPDASAIDLPSFARRGTRGDMRCRMGPHGDRGTLHRPPGRRLPRAYIAVRDTPSSTTVGAPVSAPVWSNSRSDPRSAMRARPSAVGTTSRVRLAAAA